MFDVLSRETVSVLTRAVNDAAPSAVLGLVRPIGESDAEVLYADRWSLGSYRVPTSEVPEALATTGDDAVVSDTPTDLSPAVAWHLELLGARQLVSLPVPNQAVPTRLWVGLADAAPDADHLVRRRYYSRQVFDFPSDVIPCRDGYVVTTGSEFPRFALLVEQPGLEESPLANSHYRVEHWRELVDLTWPWFAGRSRDEVLREAQDLRVALTPVLSIEELVKSPHLAARGAVRWAADGTGCEVPLFGPAFRTELARPGARPCPHRGEHTDEIRTSPPAPQRLSRELAESSGTRKWYDMSERIRVLVQESKPLPVNVDFYSASVYYTMGIPIDLFTPIFAISRVAGWTAHVYEQYSDNRLIRPESEYIGPMDVHYLPIDQRN